MIKNVQIGNVLNTELGHVAFAINKEGVMDSFVAKQVVKLGWPELEQDVYNLGSTLSKKIGDKTYHAMVCYSLRSGWQNQSSTIMSCLDQISTDKEIAVAVGCETVQIQQGAKIKEIKDGMENSKKRLVLYRKEI